MMILKRMIAVFDHDAYGNRGREDDIAPDNPEEFGFMEWNEALSKGWAKLYTVNELTNLLNDDRFDLNVVYYKAVWTLDDDDDIKFSVPIADNDGGIDLFQFNQDSLGMDKMNSLMLNHGNVKIYVMRYVDNEALEDVDIVDLTYDHYKKGLSEGYCNTYSLENFMQAFNNNDISSDEDVIYVKFNNQQLKSFDIKGDIPTESVNYRAKSDDNNEMVSDA